MKAGLATLELVNGKDEKIFNAIIIVFDDLCTLPVNKYTVSDTTAANTGIFLCAVTWLHGLEKPVFIGSQNHILVTILMRVLKYILRK